MDALRWGTRCVAFRATPRLRLPPTKVRSRHQYAGPSASQSTFALATRLPLPYALHLGMLFHSRTTTFCFCYRIIIIGQNFHTSLRAVHAAWTPRSCLVRWRPRTETALTNLRRPLSRLGQCIAYLSIFSNTLTLRSTFSPEHLGNSLNIDVLVRQQCEFRRLDR